MFQTFKRSARPIAGESSSSAIEKNSKLAAALPHSFHEGGLLQFRI